MNVTLLFRSTLIMFYLTKFFLSREIGVLQLVSEQVGPSGQVESRVTLS